MAALAVIYLAFQHGTDMWLISSARGMTAAVLVLGMVGGCMLSATRDLYAGPHSQGGRVYQAITAVSGVVALAAGLIGLVSSSTAAPATLVGTHIETMAESRRQEYAAVALVAVMSWSPTGSANGSRFPLARAPGA